MIAVVIGGSLIIAAIGFAGSYSAVRELATRKGFGSFATVFPIGVDAGIAVLLALDLLLTWLRIPFPMLRQAAWLLTAATIGFNAAAAWPDPIGVGMHGVIPILFVVTVEAARHAVGRLAAITADRHMEGVRMWRWILAPLPTFRLWRRMMLWEIRKYDEVIQAEQQRLVYQARLRGRYGRAWRWKAPVEDLLPLRIARFGVPLNASSHPRTFESDATATAAYELTRTTQRNPPAQEDEKKPNRPRRTTGTEPLTVEPMLGSLKDEAAVDADSREGNHATAQSAPETGDGRPSWGAHSDEVVAADTTAGRESERGEKELGREVPAAKAGLVSVDPSSGEGMPGDRAEGAPDQEKEVEHEHRAPASVEHEAAIERLKSNAAAVRYAMGVLGSTHTPTVVDWLAAHGRDVNRGQAHRITKDEEERQQRGQPLTMIKGAW
ncbi:DUF2637 domain-containing protein [Streptomyces sp. NPDC048638]|uniref:DUF2637 domain-containing protein n=1 Tax=Streptomyces sp. NPDC048638 TaxID=3365580 RepID=UPI0037247BB5